MYGVSHSLHHHLPFTFEPLKRVSAHNVRLIYFLTCLGVGTKVEKYIQSEEVSDRLPMCPQKSMFTDQFVFFSFCDLQNEKYTIDICIHLKYPRRLLVVEGVKPPTLSKKYVTHEITSFTCVPKHV